MAVRRLQQDLRQLMKNKVEGIDASPSGDNLFVWNAIICGPEDSIYEAGAFPLQILFPDDYPLRPPQVRFMTKLFHPNVWWDNGLVCVDILKDGWVPSYDVLAILHSIRLLLIDPNPLSPANLEAALLYRDNRIEFDRRVSEMIQASLDSDDEDDETTDNQDEDEDDDDHGDHNVHNHDDVQSELVDVDDIDDRESTAIDDAAETLRQKITLPRNSISEEPVSQ